MYRPNCRDLAEYARLGWQYIVSGVQIPQFSDLLNGMITPAQGERIGAALAPIISRGFLYRLPARSSAGLTPDQGAPLL